MKVAIYARVSSERQDIDLSISAQLKALREYASRNGYSVVKEYVDEAESGRSIDRPGFKQMIATARQKPSPFQAIGLEAVTIRPEQGRLHNLQIPAQKTWRPSNFHQRAARRYPFRKAA